MRRFAPVLLLFFLSPIIGELVSGSAPPFWFALFGFGSVVVFYIFLMFRFPAMDVPLSITILSTFLWSGAVFWVVRYFSGGGAWVEKHKLAIVSGVLAFYAFLAPIQELDETRTDDTTGMTRVGVALIVFLFWLWRRGTHGEKREDVERAASS